MEEIFEVFNEKNEKIGEAPRSEVHKKGLYHRGAIIFVVNGEGKIFLQRRSETKDTDPGYWCYGVGEHLKPGESYEQAAKRGLMEELGILNSNIIELRGPKLNHIEHSDGKIDREFDSLFLAKAEGPFNLDPTEVAEGGFFSKQEIEKDIINKSRNFTEFFLREWAEFKRITGL